MSEFLCRTSLSSQGGWASIRDMGTTDAPTSDTGEEDFLFLPGNTYIAVRPDSEGEASVEIRVGEPDRDDCSLLVEKVLNIKSGVISVSDVVVQDEETLRLPRSGEWTMSFYVAGEPSVREVVVFLKEQEWKTANIDNA
ncbi:hypothetical protein AB0F07_22555 [Streptomyces fructofermentans]|uniref:hypothetical protein n=1 Tax=Streptomyces fructofermentans TaxID=152141 RepID=UPI0033E7816D